MHIQKYPILTNANIPCPPIIPDMHSYCNIHYSLIAGSSKLAVFRFGVAYMLTMQLLSLWLADAAPILRSRFIRPGTGPIFLDDVDCRGNETNLEDCPHNGVGVHNCSHWQDAGVICQQGAVLYQRQCQCVCWCGFMCCVCVLIAPFNIPWISYRFSSVGIWLGSKKLTVNLLSHT